ncbi:MOB kinase activator-like 2 isoform X1 [Bactrocera neohumeralis]|uniref:MOB kinase activator-like 2 isoform X1 n=1 Tax=Bactrocera neohumeralis TaxID=98809 RepID=UPI002165618A|nr:MOB kinase activator-like 2 isoform X1 [Bactrocera neohumeralis]XP_050334132.1 MOB kinase activator-like 2 isoform X1 [Bactrocera neohumeralis]XP_050334133.1 MOB kinase activator-like 2 isoform X1 [Bactrocera neohumeralis]
MLRTPTHIVELSTNTTSPLLQKFHVGATTNGAGAANGSPAVGVKASSCAAAAAAAATAVQYHHQQQQQQKQTSNKFFNDRQQQQQEQQKQTTGYRFQAKGMKITTSSSSAAKEHLANATITTNTAPAASTPISAARSLLSSTPFISFKRIKKSKTTTTTTTATTNSTSTRTKTNGLIANAVVEHVYAPATVAAATVQGQQFDQSADSSSGNNYHFCCGNQHNNNNNNNYLKTEIATLTHGNGTALVKSSSSSSNASSTASSNHSAFSSTPLTASASAASVGNASNISCSTQSTAISSTNSNASSAASATSVVTMSPTTQAPTRTSLFDSCHRKIRLIGGGPVAFLGGLVAKARRKERDGDQNSTDTKLYLEESVLERKLPEADLKALVDLPAGLDYNEWLASHTLALFEHVNLVYGTISEFCTPSGCADMTGPGNRTYLWFDEKGKKTRVAAPQYIDYVMTFTQKTVSDESIFPTKYANEFPSSFESIARKILRLQFHVIAHLYAAHFREIALLGLHTHLNLTFAHLTALHRRFTLIDEKETDVLRDLEVALRLTDDGQSSLASSTITATTDGGSSSCGGGGSGGGASSGTTADSGIANSGSSYSSGGGAAAHAHHSQQQQQAGADDVNLLQQQQSAGTTLIDGDAAAPPICTQPEAQTKQPNNAHASTAAAVFGGGGGLIGGILGDLSSGEFGETATRYCTSALPQHQQQAQNAEVAVNCNNGGAGALHLNFNNNHHHHHHHHHHQHAHAHQPAAHHHFTQQQQQHQQHSGLIQCNASNAPNANTVTNAAATTATNASAAATTTTA